MKKWSNIRLAWLSGIILLVCAAANSWAQPSLTLDQYRQLKQVSIANLDKETYIKAGDFVLDSEQKPAYIFNLDGQSQRKFYLYKVFETREMNEVAKLAFYVSGTGKPQVVCVPGHNAGKDVWKAYFDDLSAQKDQSFLACWSFVMSKEMANVNFSLSNGIDGSAEERPEDYEFCFPDAAVVLTESGWKPIAQVQIGERIGGFAPDRKGLVFSPITSKTQHERQAIAIRQVTVWPSEYLTAGHSVMPIPVKTFLATPNHPVPTDKGSKWVDELVEGDRIYVYDAEGQLQTWQVGRVATAQDVSRVWSLQTESGNFWVNGVGVLGK